MHHVSGKIILERHNANSLNEPWRIVDGSLVLDDDVLRRCEALDAAFVRWTRHPDRRYGRLYLLFITTIRHICCDCNAI